MADTLRPADLRLEACRLAELGAQTARRSFGKTTISRKSDDTPVTEADLAAQGAILESLSRTHPSHAVLTEESVTEPARHADVETANYCWVIDPIDGTRNFGRGVAVWSTSVAVLHRGQPIAGAIYDSTSAQVYSASAGTGAFRGDRRITLQDRAIDSDTTIVIGSFRRREIPTVVRGWMDQYLFRNFGSLCLHFVWVAAGLVDAAYALECKLWDIAAGGLLIQEAGGKVTDHEGRDVWPIQVAAYRGENMPILAGSPLMHGRLLDSMRTPSQSP